MYIGETVEARPTPMPPTNRQTTKSTRPRAAAQPTAESMNNREETIKVRFRPRLSAIHTPARGPNGQPKTALPMTAPYQNGLSENSAFRKITAPEMSERL